MINIEKNSQVEQRLSIQQQHVIKNKIDKLSVSHCNELFELLRKKTDKYTINKNGVFINLKDLDNDILIDIDKFLEYIDSINKTLNEKRY